jgi:hypothetical protein
MNNFLEALAGYILENHAPGMESLCVLLPNRRAGVYLQRHLALLSPGVMWSPGILSVSDLVSELSTLKIIGQVELVFHLHEQYRKVSGKQEDLDEFFHWGEILSRDFDEIDKYMVDADALFSNLNDLKELEDLTAGIQEEQLKFIKQFWEGFFAGTQTREKNQFQETWKLLPRVYHGIRSYLEDRGEGYQGMQYREIAERIRKGEMEHHGWNHVIVAGFNALNACELELFDWLKQQGASFFWDYDRQYTGNPGSEAGRFMRKNLERYPETAPLDDFMGLAGRKVFRVFDLPSDMMQARNLGRILDEVPALPITDCTDTAVVLCDEELLMPVLSSMPEQAGDVNITMGYPLKNTPVMSFLNALLQLQKNRRDASGGKSAFYHGDVSSLLMHPFLIRPGERYNQLLFKRMVDENHVFVEETLFTGELEELLFRKIEGAGNWISYLRSAFAIILERSGDLNREFVLRFLMEMNRLENTLSMLPGISDEVFTRLLMKVTRGLRIPFEGEPLSGLQVMGILETRVLDFRHVILLSLNEEVMPSRMVGQTNIPYAFRLAFGMPSREDMEAIYAYYFYRLLQRAEKVDLMYNSSTEGTKTGEMSRYLHQLCYEKDVKMIRPGMDIKSRTSRPIVVAHTDQVEEKLNRYLSGNDEGKFLSPSALNTYIDCPLRFYFRHIAGIGEPEEVDEEIDHREFGTVVHGCLTELYRDMALEHDGNLSPEGLGKLLDSGKIVPLLERLFRKHHFKGRKNARIEGRNIIVLKVMERFVRKTIEKDREMAPFALISTEKQYTRELEVHFPVPGKTRTIVLGGYIDRLDMVDGRVRVIDYKTGTAEMHFKSMEGLFDGNGSSRNRAALQVLFYAWLVEQDFKGKRILPGIYPMRELFRDDFTPGLKEGGKQGEPLIDFASRMDDFLALLRETLVRIFDPAVPFIQTEKEELCRHCDYAAICGRNTFE